MAQTVSFSFTGSDFYVPRDVDRTDQEGVRRFLAGFDLAANGFADLIGMSCTLNVHAANGQSVHPNNFGVIVTGDTQSDVPDTESEPFVDQTRLEDSSLVLGPTIELYNVMMPDADGTVATSVGYTVTVTCNQQVTTTTTATTSTTTTAPSTTTTAPSTTTSPPTTAPPTTSPPTSEVSPTSVTSLPTTVVTSTPPTLPNTGGADGRWLGSGATLVVLGWVMLVAVSRRDEESASNKPWSSG
ncbi:MAG TPA: hypothetical protein VHM29_07395 [Acidimicrobiia bacterium]|nr:hypothetical protein [Acidimicrobiia bacterium]